ncbi:hypothetical protein H6F67_23010 [Microcoleus sp. FACHB-1515]|uniref:hypothetical protein n=1 Tax=Cyanophyceae TaxID=3028117 RepID=UPI00168467E9|nr:hypothetical protein [Microcoleus sp. FACHB-1515]MBD2092725.1 hypothetical protein [Microcoleus sp. FACHB-1515]
MESTLWVWLAINMLLSLFCVVAVVVMLRDRDRKKSLHSNLLKAHIQQLEQLSEIMKRLELLENGQTVTKDWLTSLTEQIDGLIEFSKKIEKTGADLGTGLETARQILKIVQSKQSTLTKLLDSTRLLTSPKQLPTSR